MKSFFTKITIFFLPAVLIVGLEVFVLPVDFFAFRAWEGMLVRHFQPAIGSFYPNIHIVRKEGGDKLGFDDPMPKDVEWFIDEYGFRNRPRSVTPESYDIVVIGDSNIAGSYTDQRNTISEVLEQKCKCPVYSYAPGPKQRFFSDARFIINPPKLIMVEARSGEFYYHKFKDWNSIKPYDFNVSWLHPKLAVIFDRVAKANMVQYIRSRLHAPLDLRKKKGEGLSASARVEFTFNAVMDMHNEARRRGSDFIFFLMPYPDRTLDEAVIRLRQAGVKVIAYLPNEKYEHGVDLQAYYQEKDSHWREEIIVKTADEILAMSKDFKDTVMTK